MMVTRISDTDILEWIAEHLTHLRVSLAGDYIAIEWLTDEGYHRETTYGKDSDEIDEDRDYANLLRGAVIKAQG
jgi:hypothetical protein